MIQARFTRLIPWASWVGTLAIAALIGLTAVPAPVRGDAMPDGKAVFEAQKCQTCHGVSKAGIESKTKSGKLFGGDLSAVAAKLDPVWATKFLQGVEKKDGETHKKKTTATDAEVAALLAWLKTQAL